MLFLMSKRPLFRPELSRQRVGQAGVFTAFIFVTKYLAALGPFQAASEATYLLFVKALYFTR